MALKRNFVQAFGDEHQSVLSIDKSEAPFDQKVHDVYGILQIPEPRDTDPIKTNVDMGAGSDPRYEWVIRWVLKTFKVGGGPESPRMNPLAWNLLHVAIMRTHMSKTSRLLKLHGFTDILRESLGGLLEFEKEGQPKTQQNGVDAVVQSPKYDVNGNIGPSNIFSFKDLQEEQLPSTKRMSFRNPNASTYTFLAILRTIHGIQLLLQWENRNEENVGVEYLKHVIRCNSKDAASTLGYLLNLFNDLVRSKESRISKKTHAYLQNKYLTSVLNLIIRWWELQSLDIHAPRRLVKQEQFSRQCLKPALLVLCSSRRLKNSLQTESLCEMLESLIADNVVMPARAPFFASMEGAEDAEYLVFLEDALCDIFEPSKTPQTRTLEDFETLVESLACLLEVFVQTKREDTSKSRREEESWFQRLFSALTSCLKRVLQDESSTDFHWQYPRALGVLLTKCVEFNLKLDVTTIHTILDETSGLFSGDQISTDWSLIDSCLKINGEAFVKPLEGVPSDSYSYQTPNIYLKALLTSLSAETSSDGECLSISAASSIILSLLYAFIQARDLSGFLEHLREQNNNLHNQTWNKTPAGAPKDSQITHTTVWKADEISNAVIHSINSNLSMSQIDARVHGLQSQLNYVETDTHKAFELGDLMVLDCLLAGCRTEELIERLADSAFSTFIGLIQLLRVPANFRTEERWRIWRLLTTISQKWAKYGTSNIWKEVLLDTAVEALGIFRDSLTSDTTILSHQYRELSFAFGYVLSFPPFDRHFKLLGDTSSIRDTVAQFVHLLLDAAGRSETSVDSQAQQTTLYRAQQNENERPTLEIVNFHSLFVSCIVQVLYTKAATSCLGFELQHRLFDQLFRSAVDECSIHQQEKFMKFDAPAQINSWWLLHALTNCDDLDSDKRLRGNIRKAQVQKYLECVDDSKSHQRDVYSTKYRVAFSSIKDLTTDSLHREQRTDVANRILDVLLFKDIDAEDFTQHLQLLSDFATTPKILMNIFKKSEFACNVDIPRNLASDTAVPLVLAWQIDQFRCAQYRIQCGRVLNRLTSLILMYANSTSKQDSSIQLLSTFYEKLGQKLQSNETQGDQAAWWTAGTTIISLATRALDFYEKHTEEIMPLLNHRAQTLKNIRRQHVYDVIQMLGTPLHAIIDLACRHEWSVILECFYIHIDIFVQDPLFESAYFKISEIVQRLTRGVSKDEEEAKAFDLGYDHFVSIWNKLLLRMSLLHSVPDGIAPQPFQILEKNALQNKKMPSPLLLQDQLLSILDKDQLHNFVGSECFANIISSKDPQCLHVLHSTILRIRVSDIEDFRLIISKAYSNMLGNIVYELGQNEQRTALFSLECLRTILRIFPRIASQHHIDKTISSVASFASRLSSNETAIAKGRLYHDLCSTFNVMLSFHRPKLGGRFHLVIPALQALLKCLFIPYSSTQRPNTIASRSRNEVPVPLDHTHAQAFTRILTLLCDPSPSAVSRSKSRSRETLNDSTKRAKSITGQYIQYLIMTYCECQLTSRLPPPSPASISGHQNLFSTNKIHHNTRTIEPNLSVKEALEPGLWAVLNCMSPEVMRAMNSALSPSARAVWKRLYDEWMEFGRWKGG